MAASLHTWVSMQRLTIQPVKNYYRTSVKNVKITGSNIVVFCMLITILNTLLTTMQNVLHLLF